MFGRRPQEPRCLCEGRPSRALRGRGGRRRAGSARAHDWARRRAEPFRGRGGGGEGAGEGEVASPAREPTRWPGRSYRRRCAEVSFWGRKGETKDLWHGLSSRLVVQAVLDTLENLQIRSPEKYGSLNHFCHKEWSIKSLLSCAGSKSDMENATHTWILLVSALSLNTRTINYKRDCKYTLKSSIPFSFGLLVSVNY